MLDGKGNWPPGGGEPTALAHSQRGPIRGCSGVLLRSDPASGGQPRRPGPGRTVSSMINPGTQPIAQASEDLAAAALQELLAAVRARIADLGEVPILTRVAAIAGDPVRDPAADRDGRYGWDLPYSDGRVVRLLIPGVPLPQIRDDITAEAPCVYINGGAWWWPAAIGILAAEGTKVSG
jgi:hypothetical protein